jgi:DNA polymerase (family 10)
MPVHNADIARILEEVGDLLEIKDANPFRVRAYRDAARAVKSRASDLAGRVRDGFDLTAIEGVGEDLAGKIQEIIETGELAQHQQLLEELPSGLLDVLKVEGVGPRKAADLYEKLGVSDLPSLRRAAREHKIRELSGFGARTEQNILERIGQAEESGQRMRLDLAEEYAEPLAEFLRSVEGVKAAEIAGSLRRRKQTVGDVDILVSARHGAPVMDAYTGYDDVDRIISKGETKSTVILKNGLQVDVRLLPHASFGAALHYFTGSKAHNVAIRKIARDRGWKINEYGVFEGKKKIAGQTEQEVYEVMDMACVPPELREDKGEIEAARNNELPELITQNDVRGDLHAHTKATDGRNSLKEMAEAARDMGYEYLAVTEHSKKVAVAGGLDEKALRGQIQAIDKLNDELDGITLLKGCEVDVLEDGSLDLPDSVLQELDLTVCSVHSDFAMGQDAMTERILRAMDNPNFTILGHPTGRKLGEREPYHVDLQRILEAAAERGCFLEVNAQPERLDLDDDHCRAAKQAGVKLAVSTDAHRIGELEFIRFGLGQARRGWIEKHDVINTRPLDQLRKLLAR